MTDTAKTVTRVRALSDKQACYIVKALAQDLFTALPQQPSFDEIGQGVSKLSSSVGVTLGAPLAGEWYATELSVDQSGRIAKTLLEALAAQPQLVQMVDNALDKYVDETLDLGIISIGVTTALIWMAVTSHINVSLAGISIIKDGIPGKEQAELAKKVLAPVVKAISGLLPGRG
jgi:hypothetical protein